MTSNLIPTVITDKNGKTATVHKKPSNGPETKTLIPAPVLAQEAPTSSSEARDKALVSVEQFLVFDSEESAPRIKATLAQYPDEMVAKLNELFDSGYGASPLLANLIEEGASPEFVNETIAFVPYLTTESPEVTKALIRSLHLYEQLPSMSDYSTASEEVQIQCRALIIVSETIDDHQYYNSDAVLPMKSWAGERDRNEYFMLLEGEELIKLVISNPKDATDIGDIITERQTGDAELIREILRQHDSKALNSGIL